MKNIKNIFLLLLLLPLMSCQETSSSLFNSSSNGGSSSSGEPSSSSSSSESSSSTPVEPFSFDYSSVSIATYDYSDKQYEVNGKQLVFNGCMVASSKRWPDLQLSKFDGEIHNLDEIPFNHVVLTFRNASTEQYTPDDYLNIYYGDSSNPTDGEKMLTSEKTSSTIDGVSTYTSTYSLTSPSSYWRIMNDSSNVVYFRSAVFSLI